MKANIKRSVFSLVLCAMLVFCIGFYSSAEPTTAYFTDSGNVGNDYNMDELNVLFEGEGIADGVTSVPLELNFKAATKAGDADEVAKMFEYAAEFYTFTATNKGTVEATVTTSLQSFNGTATYAVDENSALQHCIYLLDTSAPYTGEVLTYIPENETLKQSAVYTDSNGKRLIVHNGSYYYANLAQNLSVDHFDELVLQAADPDVSKTYCIGFWVEYGEFENLTPDAQTGVRTLDFNLELSIKAEHIHEHFPEAHAE